MKNHKIRHAIIKYKKSKKGGKLNRFEAIDLRINYL